MNIGFRAVSLTVIAMLSPCAISAAELAPGVLDAQWLVKNCGSIPQGSTNLSSQEDPEKP